MAGKVRRIRMPVVPQSMDVGNGFCAVDGFQGPFFRGTGDVDFLCGTCNHPLAVRINPRQFFGAAMLRCPKCDSKNLFEATMALFSPAAEAFIQELQAAPLAFPDLPKLEAALKDAQHRHYSHDQLIAMVGQVAPDLPALKELLTPHNPSDLLSCATLIYGVFTFVKWLIGKDIRGQPPKVVINNYFAAQDPFAGARVNDPCPCGSGKKFKKCHGEP